MDPHVRRQITVDEALALALERQQHEQLDEAEALYRRVLEIEPERPEAMHYLGVLQQQRGRSDEAVALVTRSLALVPDRADWHSNLGIILQNRGELHAAVDAYRQAIVLGQGHANAYSNLGVLLRAVGRLDEAEAAYRRAIELNPQHADAYQNLAVLCSLTGRMPEAVQSYCHALTLRPDYADARRLLALAYCIIGEPEKAVLLCEEWVRLAPDDPGARHTLAACSGRNVPPRASDDYIRQTFDDFAGTFEAKLERLAYRAPALVAEALAETGVPAARALDVVDVGCGTGLCGPMLAPYARRLVGVDLSAGMLARAREKGMYDELVQAELTRYLHEHPDSCDLVVTADTLVYFGALDEVAAAAAAALRPGGLFVCTLEADAGEAGAASHCLQPHGRYTHHPAYVERVFAQAGLRPHLTDVELRLERGAPVRGLLVRAARPAPARAPAPPGGDVGGSIPWRASWLE
jgi:predicted TPR repeat methyltransferase